MHAVNLTKIAAEVERRRSQKVLSQVALDTAEAVPAGPGWRASRVRCVREAWPIPSMREESGTR